MTLHTIAMPDEERMTVRAGLLPVAGAVFLGSLAVSIPLAALSLEMRDRLDAGPALIGGVIGVQGLSTLLTRHQAGTLADRRGTRTAVLFGLPLAAASGLAYVASGLLAGGWAAHLALLILGRILGGLGESLFLTGLMSWGIARLGPARTGKVMSWVGIAIYAALGLGAPIGLALQARFGFVGVGAVTMLAPTIAWTIALLLPSIPGGGGHRVAFHHVLSLIWRPGLILALATVPFAAMSSFLAVDYAAHGWSQAGAALFGFGAAYILVRLAAGGLADRVGAVPVAIGSLSLEVIGQLLLWSAPMPGVAILGATLTGLGFSLVFPSMGVLATSSIAAELRGRAVGNFIAFADIALAVTGPVVGIGIEWAGVPYAFLVGAVAAGVALCMLPSIRRKRAE